MSKEATLIALGTAVVEAVTAVEDEHDVASVLHSLTLTPNDKGKFTVSFTTTDEVDAQHIKDQIHERRETT